MTQPFKKVKKTINVSVQGIFRCVSICLEIVRLWLCKIVFYSHVRWYSTQFVQGIFSKTAMETLFFNAFTGHMAHLSVGTGSRWHDVAGATRSLIILHNTSKVEQIILKFLQFCTSSGNSSYVAAAMYKTCLSVTAPITDLRCLQLAK